MLIDIFFWMEEPVSSNILVHFTIRFCISMNVIVETFWGVIKQIEDTEYVRMPLEDGKI